MSTGVTHGAEMIASQPCETSAAGITVVIPAYGPSPHLRAVLEGLRAQTRTPAAIYVSHSGTDDPSAWIARDFPEVTAMHSDERLFAGAARNRAALGITDGIIAFTDCDTVPDPEWLARAHAALRGRQDRFVVGSVDVASSGGYWGMSTWLCEFSEQAPWRPASEQRGGASCNMAVHAQDFAAVGGFPEDFRAGQDTMLFHRLRSQGLAQHFYPLMRVSHFNIPGFGHYRIHLANQGRHFAKVRLAADLPGKGAVRFWPAAPLLGVAKAWNVLKRMIGNGKAGMAITYLPGILLGIAIWTAGCAHAAATRSYAGRY